MGNKNGSHRANLKCSGYWTRDSPSIVVLKLFSSTIGVLENLVSDYVKLSQPLSLSIPKPYKTDIYTKGIKRMLYGKNYSFEMMFFLTLIRSLLVNP